VPGINPALFLYGGITMKIYQDSGYIDIRKILSLGLPFNFIVGGRATGKTYTSLETVIEDEQKFIYMRRTQSQTDLINKPDFSPFKSLNRDFNWNIGTESLSKYNAGFYNQQEQDGKLISVGGPIGYTCALSTISNMRGFDASDINVLLYDEFIPEKHERPIKNEGAAFLNAYETINRNRELSGRKPLQTLCLANANDLANPIFMELRLVRKAEQMRRKKQEVCIDKERGIGLFILDKSPISQQKKTTALYRLTDGSNFEKMSINNDFSGEEIGRISSRPLAEYKPIVSIGEITLYEHKSNRSYYISTHRAGSPPTFGTGDAERARFRRMFQWIWDEYMENNIEFEEYLCEILLTKIFS
jgi:hypothetical protein